MKRTPQDRAHVPPLRSDHTANSPSSFSFSRLPTRNVPSTGVKSTCWSDGSAALDRNLKVLSNVRSSLWPSSLRTTATPRLCWAVLSRPPVHRLLAAPRTRTVSGSRLFCRLLARDEFAPAIPHPQLFLFCRCACDRQQETNAHLISTSHAPLSQRFGSVRIRDIFAACRYGCAP